MIILAHFYRHIPGRRFPGDLLDSGKLSIRYRLVDLVPASHGTDAEHRGEQRADGELSSLGRGVTGDVGKQFDPRFVVHDRAPSPSERSHLGAGCPGCVFDSRDDFGRQFDHAGRRPVHDQPGIRVLAADQVTEATRIIGVVGVILEQGDGAVEDDGVPVLARDRFTRRGDRVVPVDVQAPTAESHLGCGHVPAFVEFVGQTGKMHIDPTVGQGMTVADEQDLARNVGKQTSPVDEVERDGRGAHCEFELACPGGQQQAGRRHGHMQRPDAWGDVVQGSRRRHGPDFQLHPVRDGFRDEFDDDTVDRVTDTLGVREVENEVQHRCGCRRIVPCTAGEKNEAQPENDRHS